MADKPESENPIPSIPSPEALLYATPSEGAIPAAPGARIRGIE
jgi:hypothetical protein